MMPSNPLPKNRKEKIMQTVILIIHPPTIRYTVNYELQEYIKCVSNLSTLIEQNKGCRALTENVFQIVGGNALGIFEDAVRTLREGTSYTYAMTTEQPEWNTKVRMTKAI
jgi:hypothetical protein